MTNDFLIHYGIIGQKWGVRNGPPYPLTNSYKFKKREYEKKGLTYSADIDKKLHPKNLNKPSVLKKGSKVEHVTVNKDFAEDVVWPDNNKRLFVYYNDIDQKNYAGFFAAWQKAKHESVYNAEMKLKKDLVIANKKEQYKEFEKLIEDKTFRKYLANDVAKYLKKFDPDHGSDVKGNKEYVRNASTKEDYNRIFQWLVSYGPYEYGKSWDKYTDTLKKQYNAIEDINDTDKKGMMAAVHPLIILDVLETVGDVKVKELTDNDILQTLKSLQ